jgi:hypothetical protein
MSSHKKNKTPVPCRMLLLYRAVVATGLWYTSSQRLYLKPVPGHALLVLGDEVGAFLLGVVGGGEEHALVALCLFVGAHAAGLASVSRRSRSGRGAHTFGFAGAAAAAVSLRSAPMLAAVGGAVSCEPAGRGCVGRAVQTDLEPLCARMSVGVSCGGCWYWQGRREATGA